MIYSLILANRSQFTVSNWKRGDRGLLSQIGKEAIAVYSLKSEKGRSLFILSSWKKGDRGLLSQIGKGAIA